MDGLEVTDRVDRIVDVQHLQRRAAGGGAVCWGEAITIPIGRRQLSLHSGAAAGCGGARSLCGKLSSGIGRRGTQQCLYSCISLENARLPLYSCTSFARQITRESATLEPLLFASMASHR